MWLYIAAAVLGVAVLLVEDANWLIAWARRRRAHKREPIQLVTADERFRRLQTDWSELMAKAGGFDVTVELDTAGPGLELVIDYDRYKLLVHPDVLARPVDEQRYLLSVEAARFVTGHALRASQPTWWRDVPARLLRWTALVAAGVAVATSSSVAYAVAVAACVIVLAIYMLTIRWESTEFQAADHAAWALFDARLSFDMADALDSEVGTATRYLTWEERAGYGVALSEDAVLDSPDDRGPRKPAANGN